MNATARNETAQMQPVRQPSELQTMRHKSKWYDTLSDMCLSLAATKHNGVSTIVILGIIVPGLALG